MDSLRERLLSRLPKEAREKIAQANEQNAQEFYSTVKAAIPVGRPGEGDKHPGALVATLKIKPYGEVGQIVTLGDAAHPYPAHLEFGHRNQDGVHVPAEPFWYPARRVKAKRFRGRIMRAMNAAVKAASAYPND
jgi:hypothetical protein